MRKEKGESNFYSMLIVAAMLIFCGLILVQIVSGCEEDACNDVCGELCAELESCMGSSFPYDDVDHCCNECDIDDGSEVADCVLDCSDSDSCEEYVSCVVFCEE